MTADAVIELRRLWAKHNYARQLAAATVLAERDWLAYVQAMTAAVPSDERLTVPTEKEVNWAWPDGVVVVFAEPVEIYHTILNRVSGNRVTPTDPHAEKQVAAGLAFGRATAVPTETPDGARMPDKFGVPMLWIGADPLDIISSWWVPGSEMIRAPGLEEMGESARFMIAVVSALGHRLTRVVEPTMQGRGERRRVARELPSLRVLELASGATVRSDTSGTVEWSKRWMVRGHWRLQPHGPRRELRRMTWIDPYVKGPEGKPLDVRPTLWRARATGRAT